MSAQSATLDWSYPPSARGEVVDDYHGTKVADPYRWLEDLDSAGTRAWVAAQNDFSARLLTAMPEREQVRRRLTELWNYERRGLPDREAGRYFQARNDGLQNQSPLYVMDGWDGPARVLIDPNTLAGDGTVALALSAPSPDGRWLAYGLARGGSDWRELRLRAVDTGEDAPDLVQWAKFTGISWTHDSAGFFYSRYPEPPAGDSRVFARLEHRQLCYHRVGTGQAEDVLVLAMPGHPQRSFNGSVAPDGRHLVITITQPGSPGNSVWIRDLGAALNPVLDGPTVPLIEQFEHGYFFIGNVGWTFYFRTDAGAPRGQVVAFDADAPDAAPRVIIPEDEDILDAVRISAGRFVVTYMRDVVHRLALFDLEGRPAGEIPLPGPGVVTGVAGKFGDPELFIGYASFLAPGSILRHHLDRGETETAWETRLDFDFARYEVRQVFYPAQDGTRIPMFLVHRRDLPRDGSAPAWLHGYGGFNVVMRPQFSVPPLVWIERGGVYAMANLRGGGEYGKDWHLAGVRENRQTVFGDFIAAAEWLVAEGYTAAARLVLDGRSNGGLLVGAVLNQRPDLAAAGLPAVGVMDMLRYHRFTVGAAWASDYGTAETPEGFAWLRAYSPLHTVKSGARYPAILVTTGDQDDRVHPAHSYKYTAALQAAAHPGSGPILIHVEPNAGHGGSSGTTPVAKTIAEWALRMGFGAHHTGWGR